VRRSFLSVSPPAACSRLLRELLRVRPSPPSTDTETPPGGGGRTGRSPLCKRGAKRLHPAAFIGTLARGAQVGNAGL